MSPRGIPNNRPDRSMSGHPKRIPVGTRNKLTAPENPGFKRRWVNDVDGRVQMFLEAEYKIVTQPTEVGDPNAAEATQLGSVVRKPVGGGVNAVLMEIDQDWYNEDQLAKEQRLKGGEKSLLSEATEGYYGKGLTIERPRPGVIIDE